MEPRLHVLNLLLRELGMTPAIDTVDKRKAIQKAVYLAQVSGADLGYRYGWYLKGPYSTALTKDYYGLADQRAGDGEPVRLHPSWAAPLQNVRDLIEAPVDDLPTPDWLELLSSVHFLRKVVGLSPAATLERLQVQKPLLAAFATKAEEALARRGLLVESR